MGQITAGSQLDPFETWPATSQLETSVHEGSPVTGLQTHVTCPMNFTRAHRLLAILGEPILGKARRPNRQAQETPGVSSGDKLVSRSLLPVQPAQGALACAWRPTVPSACPACKPSLPTGFQSVSHSPRSLELRALHGDGGVSNWGTPPPEK